MSSEQPSERALLLPAEDGGLYAIPESVLERFRLSDEHRAEAEAAIPADEVEGYGQYIGQFSMGPYRWLSYSWEWTNRWVPDTSYYPPLR